MTLLTLLSAAPPPPPPTTNELQPPITGEGFAVYPWAVSSTNAIVTGVGDENARITGGAV